MTSLEQIPRNYDKHKDDSNMCFILLLSLRPFYISLHSTNWNFHSLSSTKYLNWKFSALKQIGNFNNKINHILFDKRPEISKLKQFAI